MRVNIISNYAPNTGLEQDVNLLRGILSTVFDKDLEIKKVHYRMPDCDEAEINFFFEIINPSLFSYASKNIWIPTTQWILKTWQPYLEMVDEIWVKTKEAEVMISGLTTKPVKYIGWTSIDKEFPERKNFHKAICTIGKNVNNNLDILFSAYSKIKKTNSSLFSKLPVLNIVHKKEAIIKLPKEIEDVVKLHNELKEKEYDSLLHECGLCISLSSSQGFCHSVNEAMSAGCNLLLSPIPAFKELTEGVHSKVYFTKHEKEETTETFFGTFMTISMDSVIEQLEEYCDSEFFAKKSRMFDMRTLYEKRHKEWVDRMMAFLPSINPETKYELKSTLPKEEDLPDVSVVCITRDRRLFMPILKYSYMIQSYPEDKLELVIVDDGDDAIEDTLFGVPNVKYVRLDTHKSIGEKRNIGVENAMFDTIVFMDDDDVYPNNSVLQRVAIMMKSPAKQCVFCTTIPCYDIMNYSSFMNVPPFVLSMSERVSEATLGFTKKFWEERKFTEVNTNEGETFIRGREHMCREVSPQEVIVSLTHSKNTSSRKIPKPSQPNGCHYGFNENLFMTIFDIGEKLKVTSKE